ncbi:cell surface protein SprA [Winogradskyella echinorum]|uniref:Cell surface protein SprA n=1 Tax=Winogradskyella echinorum TaxID=538189 RepID=A0ABR6Y063_9FLAO|nr:cell surface protein SprA [Winogradskyella echinorum]MBC3846127.1 cell surface protein SprA [Winogradskyella echinorum]MBC5750475.1 cell surface protein SprA [Winogradskyella echinorum]
MQLNITNNTQLNSFSFLYLLAFMMLMSATVGAQETEQAQDSTKTTFAFGKLNMPNPNSIVSKYTYDPILDRYIYTEKIGNFNINYPLILTPKEFRKLVLEEQLKEYYKRMADAASGKKEGTEEDQKNLLPEFYVNSGLFETIFGGNTINVVPQGSVDVDLGVLFSKQDNPTFSPRNRTNFTFDFDQRIGLSLLGKVGTRLQVTANYDTEASLDFQQLVKLEYTPTEDDIIRKIEVGNVNMPLNSSLITGAQSLFGVKTELQFGKTRVTAVFSEQQSQSKSVVAQGGGTLEEFEFFARDYDENRHFYLAQYFRDNYDKALLQYPYIDNRGLQITRVEVWVTNRNNQTENVRNIVAFQDLGESEAENIGLNPLPAGFVNNPGALPNNENNDFDPTNIGGPGSLLTEAVRDVTIVETGINVPVNEGFDYGKLEAARKLTEGQEYVLNSELGYISLNQRLLNDEVLAVAFQYTLGGEVYQVGEFANDGVNSSSTLSDEDLDGIPDIADVDVDGDGTDDNGTDTDGDGINDQTDADVDGDGTIDNGQDTNVDGINDSFVLSTGTPQSLVLKMLKSAVTSVEQPIWDLMMKNIYDTGAYQLSQEDFKLNIFYTEASPVNFIRPVEGTTFPPFDNNTPANTADDTEINETTLIRLFHLDKLNFNNDPQEGGDGFFDYVEGMTVLSQNGKIIFTKAEPFGRYLFDVLDDDGNPGNNATDYEQDIYTNPNQEKYVYDLLYKSTKTQALDEVKKNKFQIKGRFKSSGSGGGIPLGAFNVPRGSVKVTAGGRVLVEGIDYQVNYQIGRVEILDEALKASNTPINVSVENNAVFGQQTKRFTGINIEHQFNENFVLGATLLNLNERPITQKANYNSEPINNTIFGFNGNYSTEVPFLTRLANKLPNIDTDVPSNLSVRGEFAYLLPGAPKGADFDGEATAYIDDFEGTQGAIDLLSPLSWTLSSRPKDLPATIPGNEDPGIENGYGRAFLNWYTIDPIFFSNQRPNGITDDDVSNLYTRRVFIEEIFPQVDVVQGQTSVINTLDLSYYPTERGPYNFDPNAANGAALNPNETWAGITRQITSTDFEQANVEYIEFWVQDPFLDNPTSQGGKLLLNLGNISEDILKDGKKQYENGLPEDGDISTLNPTAFGGVVPQNQSLIYTFGTTGAERANQDVGFDGYDDAEELAQFGAQFGEDPSKDNYRYYLNTDGNIPERYKNYNGVDGNTPDVFTDTNRGSTTQPDVEDINRDNTMNTIDSYYEYEVDMNPSNLNINNPQINDVKVRTVTLPNGDQRDVTWYQYRLPINEPTSAIGGITDIRSIRFARLYLREFTENTILRFATLDLVRSDWRRYTLDLDNDPTNNSADAEFNVGIIGVQENDGDYVIPPGVRREELNNNNTVVRQNEQSLVLQACELEPEDSRGVFKNISVDMRQYKNLRMFLHAEPQEGQSLAEGELIAFIRMGNDLTQNFYQIEVPLLPSDLAEGSLEERIWPEVNEINIPLEVFQQIKSKGIFDQSLSNDDPTFYDVIGGELNENPVSEFSPLPTGQQRVAIKGNPNYGDIRVLMVGLKNSGSTSTNSCGEVWFNELRMSDLDNEGGWAAILSMDTNIADFASISATGRRSTVGFGGIEQGPNERSREDVKQYDVVTNVQLGQLLPKKWGVQIPFNYSQSEETITPQYDEYYRDIELQTQLDNTTDQDSILRVNENYTKRKSINFIGVRKQRTGDAKPRFYDVENLTFNYSYNKVEHRDFEIEKSLDQNVRAGVNYSHAFEPLRIEPFKKNDSLFTGKNWKILKDFNLNLLPSSFSVNTDINRQFSKQKFREVELGGENIGIEELFRRNYTFDFQYAINYNLTDALSLNFTAANTNIVRNYFIDDRINGRQDPELNVWDGFFDFGDPNYQTQQLQVNYELPLYKIPALSFLRTTYAYNGAFQWQKGSDLNEGLEIDGVAYDLGHSIQNSNTHNINTTLNMETFYKTLGLVRKGNSRGRNRTSTVRSRNTKTDVSATDKEQQAKDPNKLSTGKKAYNTLIDVITMVKRVQFGYTENNGTYLPGYLPTPGFVGTFRPTLGYTFGSQRDIRDLVANKGYLTDFQDFNQQYTETQNKTLDYSVNVEPMRDLKIDLQGNRTYAENFSENFRVEDQEYISLTPNTFGNFNISTAMIKTAFSKSDENQSATFDDFRENRLIIANRLARKAGININDPANLDAEGYPLGFGKNSQRVLLPAFLSAYQGSNPDKVSTGAFRDVPIPNWTLKYTGLMKIPWFKKNFRRFSIQHGYRARYTINQFRTNLDYEAPDYDFAADAPANEDAVDQAGNFKNETLYSNINLEEQFSPLIRLDFEMKNSVKVLAEVKTDRTLSLSFDNNLMTEIQGKVYTLGLGYRIKDLRIRSKLAGAKQVIVSDLDMQADISVRDNKTIIRYLDLENNQITAGQTIWGLKYTANYAFSKNLSAIFYFDYTFSDFAISTSFPQTSLRSGITLRYNFGN